MGTFRWKMNEADWLRMKKVDASNVWGDGMDCFGCCTIGKICFEFHHTLDTSAWYLYVDSYVIGESGGYGCMSDGTPYDFVDNEIINTFFAAETFEDFKQEFEEEVLDWASGDSIVLWWIGSEDEWEKYV